ncbi:MAG: glycosyltransferase, partial [Clostridiales bacterium]|nr:glycosyltransferase [Clostridiales bacterium]
MAKEITLIIPVYNGEAHLRRCLDSAVSQSHQSYEILVIDDGSTDGSRAICEEYKARFPFLKVIHQEQNRGLMASWQHGVRLAEGDYIAFLDSDDWVDRQYLEVLAS